MSFVEVDHDGEPVTVCRTGYTGERGYELVVPSSGAVQVWDAVLEAGAPYGLQPAGLGARDTLRTEMGYPLHGQDISPTITPVQARLGWAVGWKKDAFFGDDALRTEKQAGPDSTAARPQSRRPRHPASRHGDPRRRRPRGRGGRPPGTFSPTLKTGIGLALIAADLSEDDVVTVDIRTRREQFVITKPPFVTPAVREP